MAFLIGTRGSQLALAQAEMVRQKIAAVWPSEEVQLETVKTLGDRLSASEAQEEAGAEPVIGLFTKELDEALLAGKVRAAIHSLKDVPTVLHKDIQIAAFVKRADCRDALISRAGQTFLQLPTGARIGTSSPRREAQIRARRPDLQVLALRGNVDTRLRKLSEGAYDAVIIAAAGLERLGRETEITERLDPSILLPSAAQGILCVTARRDDGEVINALRLLNDAPTWLCARAERSFLRALQGGCRVPVGALATIHGDEMHIEGVIAHTNGQQVLRYSQTGVFDQPEKLGENLAEHFIKNGAKEILSGYGRGGW